MIAKILSFCTVKLSFVFSDMHVSLFVSCFCLNPDDVVVFPLRHLTVPGSGIHRIYKHQRGLIHITRFYLDTIVVKYQRNVIAKHALMSCDEQILVSMSENTESENNRNMDDIDFEIITAANGNDASESTSLEQNESKNMEENNEAEMSTEDAPKDPESEVFYRKSLSSKLP